MTNWKHWTAQGSYRIAGNFDGGNFDRCWLFKYLMKNILTDGQCLLPNTVLPLKFDGLNFDGLAGKHQNRQNFPPSKFPAIRYINNTQNI